MFLFSEAAVLSDIHCHLVPYVDDGAADIEDALELIKDEYSQGVRHIVMTPHLRNSMFDTKVSDVKDQFAELKHIIQENDLKDLSVYLSREYHCDSRLRALLEGYYAGKKEIIFEENSYIPVEELLPFGRKRCILLEFSTNKYQKDEMIEFTELALDCGYTPVIAHAERYRSVQEKPESVNSLRRLGAYIQVNADALLGEDAKEIVDTARKLVFAGNADIVASDAHDPKFRKPMLKKCYGYLKRKIGKDKTDMLMNDTAVKLLEG